LDRFFLLNVFVKRINMIITVITAPVRVTGRIKAVRFVCSDKVGLRLGEDGVGEGVTKGAGLVKASTR